MTARARSQRCSEGQYSLGRAPKLQIRNSKPRERCSPVATTKRGPPRAEMDSRFRGNDREGTGQGSGAFTHHSQAMLHPGHPLGPRVSPSPPASPIEGEGSTLFGACRGAKPLCVNNPPPCVGAQGVDQDRSCIPRHPCSTSHHLGQFIQILMLATLDIMSVI